MEVDIFGYSDSVDLTTRMKKLETKIEIDAKRLELQRQIDKAEKVLISRKRKIIAIASLVMIASAIGYYFSYVSEHYYLAIMFAIIGVVGAVAVAVAGVGVAGIAGAGIAGAGIAGAGVGIVAGAAIGTFIAAAIGAVAAVAAEELLSPLKNFINELTDEKDALEYLSPEKNSRFCNAYAKWIDDDEPMAVEFHAKLGGRKPTIGEFKYLAKQIKNKNESSEQELAKAACDRLFGQQA